MKQLLQNLKNGASQVVEVPCPNLNKGQLLIQTKISLISSGTERMLAQFGRSNLLNKALQQPDKVKMVFNKIKTDGVFATLDSIKTKLDQALPMGYSNVGRVLAVGQGVTGWSVGDRVLSNGSHAEVIQVPQNLCAKIPDNVADEEAVFTVLAAIGLQGIRLAMPTLGETFVVMGLGLIGLLTVQLLRAQGCRVIGIDYDRARLSLAEQFGAATVDLAKEFDPLALSQRYTQGHGVDGVLITASTQSSEPVHQAAQMCRKRGRIVLIGVTGLELSRADFYEKELSFQVSCSYGPGRYDPSYEELGQDYPIGFVRWTEQRNFEAILELLATEKLIFSSLISHRFNFTETSKAYDLLMSNEPSLGILLQYPDQSMESLCKKSITLRAEVPLIPKIPMFGFIGAGNYAGRILIPAFKKADVMLKTIVTNNGINSTKYGRKFAFEQASTDIADVLNDIKINSVVIATRHDSHAKLVCQALEAGKHVFVEKPLCLTLEELAQITATVEKYPALLLMVGFNRRFAPQVQQVKKLLHDVSVPKAIIMTVNAGAIPITHWTQNDKSGGGRIIGEACHFIDLLRFLIASPIINFHASQLREKNSTDNDKVTITLNFADGSIGTIHYFANGHTAFPKERLDIFCANRVLQLNNYRTLTGFGWRKFKKMRNFFQDKGQISCVKAFIHAICRGEPSPIPIDELLEVSRVTIQIAEFLRAEH